MDMVLLNVQMREREGSSNDKNYRQRYIVSEPEIEEATKADMSIVQDLEDTLRANRERCVGMAANMIGYRKRIIIVATGFADIIMINPVITEKSEGYETEEGCLSLPGVRKTIRYNKIAVKYLDKAFKEHTQTFSGYIAQIIQHEYDHLEGILI